MQKIEYEIVGVQWMIFYWIPIVLQFMQNLRFECCLALTSNVLEKVGVRWA